MLDAAAQDGAMDVDVSIDGVGDEFRKLTLHPYGAIWYFRLECPATTGRGRYKCAG